jgi:glycosyltransferase involved in cell wall biosynthesis
MAGAERLFANSSAVAARIRSTYGVDADVLPPPAGVNARGPQRAIPGIEPGFVLSVGRLLAYKNVDALVTAAGHVPGCRLVVAGDGPERARLQAAAGPEVVFTGEVADAELRWLYANCAGVASASREDYGLTPLEAAVHGRPAATLRFGGFLDTVAEGETGVFFDTPDVGAVSAALTRMITTDWERDRIMAQATTFGEDAFCAHLRTAVATVATRGAPVPKPDLAPARRAPAPKLARRSARAHG